MKKAKFKEGAASFYIVAISTLILVIIAASFAAVIISEITRTSNDDLAQSAYDSALAGVEDAKLVYYNYQSCKENPSSGSGTLSCADIINWVENGSAPSGEETCDMVATILGRQKDAETGGVMVKETNDGDNNMQQFYTCVTVTNKLDDVEKTVSESNPSFTVRLKFDNSSGVDVVDKIEKVKVKWHSENDTETSGVTNFANFSDKNKGLFKNDTLVPAVISVGMVQTDKTFNLSDFDMTIGNTTDRGTVYLVPYIDENTIGSDDRYIKAEDNYISAEMGMLKSNDKTVQNKPFAVQCYDDRDYACEAEIGLPRPVEGPGDEHGRNEDTFVFRVSLPYGGPTTHFSLEFYCGDSTTCLSSDISEANSEFATGMPSNKAILEGVQVKIDSTGRANDLYRRVETRLMPTDTTYAYPLYAIQVLGSGNDSLIDKSLSPTCEWNFDGATGPQGLCENT